MQFAAKLCLRGENISLERIRLWNHMREMQLDHKQYVCISNVYTAARKRKG